MAFVELKVTQLMLPVGKLAWYQTHSYAEPTTTIGTQAGRARVTGMFPLWPLYLHPAAEHRQASQTAPAWEIHTISPFQGLSMHHQDLNLLKWRVKKGRRKSKGAHLLSNLSWWPTSHRQSLQLNSQCLLSLRQSKEKLSDPFPIHAVSGWVGSKMRFPSLLLPTKKGNPGKLPDLRTC